MRNTFRPSTPRLYETPRPEIHSVSTLCCSPAVPLSKSATRTIASASAAIVPSTAHQPLRRRGSARPTRPNASGAHSNTLSIRPLPSLAGDQEVEGESGEATDQQQGIGAHET